MLRTRKYFRLLVGTIGVMALLNGGCTSSTTTTDSSSGGGTSGTDTGGSSTGGTTTTTDTITLSGQVAVNASDVASLSLPPTLALGIRPKFTTSADTPLANASVTLVKITADGTETTATTTTTDATGNYTLEAPAATGGTGAATDFYYEVRVTSGDVTVRAPAAPSADETVNVSPETHYAAEMLSDVQAISGDVMPRPEAIENVRELVAEEIVDNADSLAIPSITASDSIQLVTATALASNGGNAERALNAFEAEKEQLALETSTDTDDVGAYLETVAREGCNYSADFNFPESARDALAQAFISNATVTPTEIITAFNDNNGSATDSNVTTEVSEIDTMLTALDTAFSDQTEINSTNDIGLYVKRDLTAATFDASTELKVDQAIAFTQGLFTTPCQPQGFDFIGYISDLTGQDIASTSAIVDRQIFQDSGFGCNGGKGHLRSEIQVYTTGGTTVNGVTLSKNGGAAVSLTASNQNGAFSRWTLPAGNDAQAATDGNPTFYCMDLPSDVDYTINVDLEGASDLSETVAVQHRSVPEANISFVALDGTETQLQNNATTPTNAKRPVFKWTPAPGVPESSVIADAPAGSKIKFTFELSYINTSDQQQSPLNNSACPTGGSTVKFLDRNYFIADSDCDIAACATAVGTSESNIACRTNIQTYLVDENDRILGQAAGNFRQYCYDSNNDGDCGN